MAASDTIQTPAPPSPTGSRTRLRVLLAAGTVVVLLAAGLVWWLVVRGGSEGGGSADVGPAPYDADAAVAVEDLGAVGDGRTDDTQAVQAAFDQVEPGGAVLLAEGRTYAVSDVLTLAVDDVVITGGGTLLATDEERSSLTISADDVVVQDITLTIEDTSRRFDAFEQQRLRLDGHSGIEVRGVTVEGSAAAGIYVYGTGDFVLDRVRVSGTEADGVHMTAGAHDGQVLSPVVRDVGDDGVAVVSYAQDGDPCARIRIESPTVETTAARGVSVVGGEDVIYTDITVSDTAAAGVYIASEANYDTTGISGVRVEGGTVTGANADTGIDHGAVLVYNGGGDRVVDDVTVTGLELSGTRDSASRWVGLVSDGDGRIEDITLDDLSIDGSGPSALLSVNSDATTFETSGWTRDGDDVEDPAA